MGRPIDGDHPCLKVLSDPDEATMNYVLQVLRGRSSNTTLKLSDGVTSVGRHDDCWIRIKSSQVSRKHCEIFESGGKLTIRDLGSSNGTYVNGKRVLGQQALTVGDEVTLGAVTLRVAKLGQAAATGPAKASSPKPTAGDTAVVEAIPVSDEEEEFEMEFEQSEPEVELDVIPLADDDTVTPAAKPAPKAAQAGKAAPPASAKKPSPQPAPSQPKDDQGDEAIAQFLSDLKLDEDE
jgi:predicted component of type VI protein secretion system